MQTSAVTTSNPKFFLGDDDSNSDASLSENEETEIAKPTVTTTTTATASISSENSAATAGDKQHQADAVVNKLLSAKPFGFNKLNQGQVASASWSSLKNAASASSTANLPGNVVDADASAKSAVKSVDAFQKFKMQMLEKVNFYLENALQSHH